MGPNGGSYRLRVEDFQKKLLLFGLVASLQIPDYKDFFFGLPARLNSHQAVCLPVFIFVWQNLERLRPAYDNFQASAVDYTLHPF